MPEIINKEVQIENEDGVLMYNTKTGRQERLPKGYADSPHAARKGWVIADEGSAAPVAKPGVQSGAKEFIEMDTTVVTALKKQVADLTAELEDLKAGLKNPIVYSLDETTGPLNDKVIHNSEHFEIGNTTADPLSDSEAQPAPATLPEVPAIEGNTTAPAKRKPGPKSKK